MTLTHDSTQQQVGTLVFQRIDRATAALSEVAQQGRALRQKVVTSAVAAFIETEGDPRRSAQRVDSLVHEVGIHFAQHSSADELRAVFDCAQREAMRALGLVDRSGMGHMSRGYVARVGAYIQMLSGQALQAYERERFRGNLDPHRARDILRRTLFYTPPETFLRDVVENAAGVAAEDRMVPVVALSGSLPRTWRADPRVLAGLSDFEALSPPALVPTPGTLPPRTRIVVGLPAPWTDAADALAAVRKLAAMVRDGEVDEDRVVVPYADWMVEVYLRINDLEADALIERFLGPLMHLSVARRRTLADTILQRLESSLPMSQLAQEMGVAPQTLHGRLQRLRGLLGEDWMTNARIHNDLVMAARAALRRWQ